jgi:hypothetical protein
MEQIQKIKGRINTANIIGLLVIFIVAYIDRAMMFPFPLVLVIIVSIIIGIDMNAQIKKLKALNYTGSVSGYRLLAMFYVTGLLPAAISLLITTQLFQKM